MYIVGHRLPCNETYCLLLAEALEINFPVYKGLMKDKDCTQRTIKHAHSVQLRLTVSAHELL